MQQPNRKESVERKLPAGNEIVIENIARQEVPMLKEQEMSSRMPSTAKVPVQKPKFKVAHINELYNQESEMPVLPPAKTNTVFSFRKEVSSAVYNEVINDENSVVQKKGKIFFSLFNTSQ